MSNASQPAPDGLVKVINLKQSMNLDNVNENVYDFDADFSPHLTNTGILRDEGVTNLYQTNTVSGYDQTLFAPNGKKIELSYASGTAYVDGSLVATIGPYGLASRTALPFGAIDAAKTSTGTTLLLTRSTTQAESRAFVTTPAPGGIFGWSAIAYGNGVWIATSLTTSTTQGIARSTDGGATWTFVTTSAPGGSGWNAVGYGNGVWIAVASTTSTTQGIARSTDGGLTWNFVTTAAPGSGWSAVNYGNGVWVATAATNTTNTGIARSTDAGLTWNFVTTTAPAGNWNDAAYGNAVWIATSSGTTTTTSVARSTDGGLTWTFVTTATPGNFWVGTAYGNGIWVIIARTTSTTAGIARSTDNGVTWNFVTTTAPGTLGWTDIAYGNGVWTMTAGTTSTTVGIARSVDGGVTWTFITTTAPAGTWGRVAFGVTSSGLISWIAIANTLSTTAGIFRSVIAATTTYSVLEYNGTSVINTMTLTTTIVNLPNFACLVKTHAMTFASVQVAYIYFSGTTVTAAVFVAGVSNTAFTGTGLPNLFNGLSAFSNGGTTIIAGVCDTTATGSRAYYNTTPSNYGAWTAVGQISYLSNYEDFNMLAGTTINLIGIPTSTTGATNGNVWATKVSISTAGAVTTTTITEAGLVVIPTDTYSGFGFRSGRYKSTAATQYSPFILDRDTSPPPKIQETVTAYGSASASTYGSPSAFYGPQAACSIGSISGVRAFLYTIAGKAAQVLWGGGTGIMPISEYGNVWSGRPVDQWTDGTNYYVMWQSGGVGPGSIVLATISPNSYGIRNISKDVVQLTDSYGTIIDTLTGYTEPNQGGHCPSFMTDIYLAGSNQLAYQTVGKYSNAADPGVTTNIAGLGTSITITSISGAVRYPMTFFQASSGTLFGKALVAGGALLPADPTVAYVANTNLPPPVDAIYAGGIVQMSGLSALQTVNESDADGFSQYYAGYTLANQYPISYQGFNLFGTIYGFDGTKIYRLPVNGATAGTPEQVAIATGLQFIANSPTTAWFVSSFDNSVWVFSGGQSLVQWQQMTGMALVSSGSYETRENALYLQLADSTVLIFREDLASQITNAFASQITYPTDLGIFFVNSTSPANSALWIYYAGTGTPITLTWQSGFNGFGHGQYTRITKVVFTLKVLDPITTDIVINYKYVDSGTNGTETATIIGGSYMASATGYVRIQYNPTQPESYGASVGIQCAKKVILYEVVLYYTNGGIAQIPVGNNLP